MRQQGSERLETIIYALHPPPFVAVGDFSSDSLFCFHRRRGWFTAFVYSTANNSMIKLERLMVNKGRSFVIVH
jgi:hypothetical protein